MENVTKRCAGRIGGTTGKKSAYVVDVCKGPTPVGAGIGSVLRFHACGLLCATRESSGRRDMGGEQGSDGKDGRGGRGRGGGRSRGGQRAILRNTLSQEDTSNGNFGHKLGLCAFYICRLIPRHALPEKACAGAMEKGHAFLRQRGNKNRSQFITFLDIYWRCHAQNSPPLAPGDDALKTDGRRQIPTCQCGL